MIHELIIGGVLSSVLLRAYIEVKSKEGQEEAWRFLARPTRATVLLPAAISVLIVLAAPAIFRLYTTGNDAGFAGGSAGGRSTSPASRST